MVLRFLMRYLGNNEQLVQKLSESYPVRRTAQLVLSVFFRSKNLAEEHKLTQLTPDRFKSFFKTFQNNLKTEIEDAKNQMKQRK